MEVPILSELKSKGQNPEYLFWIGCAGSFDDRSKKVTRAFVKILNKANISYAILGKEESCTCLLYTSPSPRDATLSRMPSSA